MKASKYLYLMAGISLALFAGSAANAKNKVIVVPLGTGSELKPLHIDDTFRRHMAFGQTSDIRPLFTTNSTYAYVITSMHVHFRANFPATRDSVGIRIRTGSSLVRSWYVPNDDYTTIDFGTGYVVNSESTTNWSIDVFNRGGYGNGIANFIYVDFYGYRVRK